MNGIPEIIKRLRATPNSLSQSEIARRTGMSQSRISRWEAGDVADSVDDAFKLIALAKELGVDVVPTPEEKVA